MLEGGLAFIAAAATAGPLRATNGLFNQYMPQGIIIVLNVGEPMAAATGTSPTLSPIERLQRFVVDGFIHSRLAIIVAFHLALTSFGYVLAVALRFDFDPEEVLERIGLPLALLLFFRHFTYYYWSLNRGYWRYVSTADLSALAKAHLVSSILFAASLGVIRPPNFPRSVIFIELALSLILSGGVRFAVRLLREKVAGKSRSGDAPREVLVLGAGDSGHLVVKQLLSISTRTYQPVAVLDDNSWTQGMSVHGIPVVGTLQDLKGTLERYPHAAAVILAIPSLSPLRVRELEAVCSEISVPLKRVQSFEDIACADGGAAPDGIRVEEILECDPTVEHESEIRRFVQNRKVLISGAGGSIGSEIVRQVAHFSPQEIILVDNSEYNLFKIGLELQAVGNVPYQAALCSIASQEQLNELFLRVRPQIVFHAAAYKHVPLLEANPQQAFYNNILGTKNVFDAAYHSGTESFVMISTDKAVAPSSVMGCTKRIAEEFVRQQAPRGMARPLQPMQTAIVRFGNVINSNGSVVPLFREQIARGGPLTVTHPEMTRYFMSLREAVRLVLAAATLTAGGDLFVLDMGKPIRIMDVARKMLALYGRRDIQIVITGIRPGEKLNESLTDDGEVLTPTRLAKVRKVAKSAPARFDVLAWFNSVNSRVGDLPPGDVAELLQEAVLQIRDAGAATRDDSRSASQITP